MNHKRKEELITVVIVVGIFLLVTLVFACILNSESVAECWQRLIDCICCRKRKPESVQTFRDLNEFLLGADDLGRLENGGGKSLRVIAFFHNVLEDEPKTKQMQTTHEEAFSEQLL